jgi:hypothetical protein
MTEEKKIKIEFAPGAFDNFEGTQEDLDGLMTEIQNMFLNKTPEEIKAMSTPLSELDFDEIPDEVKEQLMRSYSDDNGPGRILQ